MSELAERIKETVNLFNALTAEAQDKGLKVEINTVTASRLGREDREVIHVKVFKPL